MHTLTTLYTHSLVVLVFTLRTVRLSGPILSVSLSAKANMYVLAPGSNCSLSIGNYKITFLLKTGLLQVLTQLLLVNKPAKLT